jgi:hypothetical protein
MPWGPSAGAHVYLGNASATRYSGRDPKDGFDVVDERPEPNEAPASAQVLKFQLRRRAAAQPPRGPAKDGDTEPLDDLAQYEDEDAHVDYRQRMLMNVIAVTIVVALVGAGVWIADTIADMQKIQDCAMQGRQNCAPIEVPVKR